jgi:zinc protease
MRNSISRGLRPVHLVLAMFFLACGFPPAASADTKLDSRRLDYVEKTLPNGLRVITHEDFSCPIVAVQVWYHVGSKNEDPQRQGFAHMFEHMMFRGTDRLGPKSHFELIRKSGGDCNAYTSFDQTVYVQKLPANQLELALYLEAERMAFLKIDEESFFTERAVVEEERRVGLNAPYGTVAEKALSQIFTKHPYRWTPIGQIPHLRAATIDELARFWETYYVPNNAVLVISGAVRHDDAHRLAEKYFGWIPRGAPAPKVTEMEPAQSGPREINITEKKGPVTLLAMGYRAVPMNHPDAQALEVMTQILGGGESSRLYQDLVKSQDIAVFAGAGVLALEQDGLVGAFAALKPFGGDKNKVFQALATQIERMKTEPPTEEEMTKAKRELIKGQIDAGTTIEGKARLMGTYAMLMGDLSRLNKRYEEIEAVTPEDVTRVARQYLVESSLNRVVIEPSFGELLRSFVKKDGDEGAEPATKPAENRVAERAGPKAQAQRPESFPTTAPVAPLSAEFPAPKTVRHQLPNGLSIVVIPNSEVPLLSMTLGIRRGASTDPADKPGAASMAAGLIRQGTENFDSKALALELESNAITLGGSMGLDVGAVSASATSDQAERTMRLLAEVVRRPTFPEKEFEQLRTQMLSSMSIQEQTPSYLADRELRRQVWKDHPYSREASGEASDVRKLTPQDLRNWWFGSVRPDTTTLYVAGDVDPEQIFRLAETYFGDWSAEGPTPSYTPPPVPSPVSTRIFLVDKPGSVQSEIRVGHAGITRSDPRWAAARVLTQIFGGSFNSRLNESLRVKKGLTYGISGYFSASRDAGSFTITTFSKTPSTAEAVRTILDEIQIMRTGPIQPAELDDARSFLVGSFAGQRELPEATISDLWLMEYCGLPADFLQKNLAQVASITESDVRSAARALIRPEELVIVVVGDAKAVQAELESIAPVELIGKAGSPTTAPSR